MVCNTIVCSKHVGPAGMPAECLPVEGKPRGRLSYTITDEASGAKVEVLLKARAFRIVKIARFSKKGYLVSFVFPCNSRFEHILVFNTFPPIKA